MGLQNPDVIPSAEDLPFQKEYDPSAVSLNALELNNPKTLDHIRALRSGKSLARSPFQHDLVNTFLGNRRGVSFVTLLK